jgi:hypothetical protein
MSTYVVTVPGTFLDPPSDAARAALVGALRPADPKGTGFGAAEDLDILTVYEGTSAFSLRLEVTADSVRAAEEAARALAASALREAGLAPDAAPLGQPVITGLTGE